MQGRNFLIREIRNLGGSSRSAKALCCAIIEDAEAARGFPSELRSPFEMMSSPMFGPVHLPFNAIPPPRDLTSLIG
jgi:hypothetical protein